MLVLCFPLAIQGDGAAKKMANVPLGIALVILDILPFVILLVQGLSGYWRSWTGLGSTSHDETTARRSAAIRVLGALVRSQDRNLARPGGTALDIGQLKKALDTSALSLEFKVADRSSLHPTGRRACLSSSRDRGDLHPARRVLQP